MSEPAGLEHDNKAINLLIFFAFCAAVCLTLIFAHLSGLTPVEKGKLADSDCYMHLIRASDLYKAGHWYEPVLIKSNTPYGEGLHWSRPFDVLLLAGSIPLALFIDFKSALFFWGVIISPLLLALTLIILNWSTRAVLSKDGPFLIGCVFVFQPILLSYFQAGRPDHHSLLILFFILSIGLVFRIILKPFNASLCYIAGALTALSVWISIESTLLVATIIVTLALFWILENTDFSRKGLHYSLALFITTGFNMILERPLNDLATCEFDRLSIVHFTIFGLTALFWIVVRVLNRRTKLFKPRKNRLSFSLLAAATAALTIWLLFPKFYYGPFADVDPRIFPLWFSKISEVQPLLSKSVPFALSLPPIGMAIVCFPFLLYLLLWDNNIANKKCWLYILLSLIPFGIISLYQLRWSAYTAALLSIPMTEIICRLLMRQNSQSSVLWRALKRTFIILIFATGFTAAGILADKAIETEKPAADTEKISLIPLCRYLNQAQSWQKRNLRILTDPDFGAEILYRTRHEVVGTANRYGPGILDTYDAMTADTDEKALRILQKRKIDLILLCPQSTEATFYSKPSQASTFYQRLRQDTLPPWLNKVQLPDELSPSFLLFELRNP